jgi:hypothetical protein
LLNEASGVLGNIVLVLLDVADFTPFDLINDALFLAFSNQNLSLGAELSKDLVKETNLDRVSRHVGLESIDKPF